MKQVAKYCFGKVCTHSRELSITRLSGVLLITFLLHLVLGDSKTETQIHSRYDNGALLTKYDHVLPGNTVTSVFLPSLISCNQKCLAESDCGSFNYQMNRAEGASGLCELKNIAVSDSISPQSLLYRSGYVFTQIYAKRNMPTSCLDHGRNIVLRSGLYDIYDGDGTRYQVYCDLTSESGMAWTLVMSQTFQHRALAQFQKPMFLDAPLNQESPRWDEYRLSLSQMKQLKSVSSRWRVTCNFPTEGLKYTDYVRAKFSEFDALHFNGHNVCKKVEYMNVRGHNCTGCTATWWQYKDAPGRNFLHHDSDTRNCEFGRTAGAVSSEDNFGFYGGNNVNPQFRCTSGDHSSTNHWFGGRV